MTPATLGIPDTRHPGHTAYTDKVLLAHIGEAWWVLWTPRETVANLARRLLDEGASATYGTIQMSLFGGVFYAEAPAMLCAERIQTLAAEQTGATVWVEECDGARAMYLVAQFWRRLKERSKE